MADSPNLIEEQAKLISRSKKLASLTPEITKWFGDLNSYVRVTFNDNAKLLRVLQEAEKHFTSIEEYVSDIERFPNIKGVNFLDFSVLHEEILDQEESVKAEIGVKKSEEYLNELFPFLDEIYTTQFSDVSGNYQIDLKEKINRNLDIFRLHLSPRFQKNIAFKSYVVYPYFVYVLFSLLDLTFKLLTDLQEEAWKNLSEAKQAALKAERDALIQSRQNYRGEHSKSAVVNVIASIESNSRNPGESSSEQTISERAREVAKQYEKESRNNPLEISIEDYLQKEPSSRKLVEMMAKNAAWFEQVPLEYLELIRRELRSAPISIQSQAAGYFEKLRIREQATLISQNGGKLPLYPSFDDFGDPKLRKLITKTRGDILQTIAALRGRVEKTQASPETFNKFMLQPYGKSKENVGRLKDELGGTDRKNPRYEEVLKELANENAVFSAQEEFFKTQWFRELPIAQRAKVIFNQVRGVPLEVIIDPDATISGALGLESIQVPSDAQENFALMDEESRGSMLGALRNSFKGKSKKETVDQLKSTAKSVKNLGTLLKSPAFLAGAGVAGGAGLFLSGLATQTPGLMGAGGALAGASAGAFIGSFFGGIGAIPGFLIGGAIGGVTGGGGAYLYGKSLFPGATTPLSNITSPLNQIGQQGLLAATNAAPGTLTNAATTLSSTLPSAQASASTLANAAINGAKTFLGAVQTTGISLPVTPIIVGTLSTAAVATIITYAAIFNSFIIPGDAVNTCSDLICIEKTATPAISEDPTSVVYTIKITPKDPEKSITITKVLDVMSVSYDNTVKTTAPPVPQLDDTARTAIDSLSGSLPPEGKTITYTINFDSVYDDTRITNQVSVEYSGNGKTDSFKIEAAVTFGQPPALGCWPVSGTITQLPFNPGGTHRNRDAYDIAATSGTQIYSPYSGTAYAFNQGGAGLDWSPAGNFVVVKADIGYDFIFEHMSSLDIPAGASTTITAGTPIGKIGSTGNSTGPHLHYEVRRDGWNIAPTAGPPSLLATLVPTDIDGQPISTTDIGQSVSATTCGKGVSAITTEREGCYVFSNGGSKAWTTEEITKVRTTLKDYILNSPQLSNLACTNGDLNQDIILTRTKDLCQDTGGSWSAYTSQNSIEFCDRLFDGDFSTSIFGRSSVIHEQAHIIQLRHLAGYSSAISRYNDLFATPNSFYTDTFPYNYETSSVPISGASLLTKITQENFGEAFGLCRGLSISPSLGYRGKYIGYANAALLKYQQECNALTAILNSLQK